MLAENKRSEIGLLYDLYAPALSERQRVALDLYYNEDLSLSEIAEHIGITRQGVRNAIVRGEKYLYFLEDSLKIAKRESELQKIGEKIISLTDDAKIHREVQKLLK